MATLSTAHFRNNVLVEGVLSGQTILRLDNEKTQLLNSLNQHISDFQAEQTATQTARDNLQTQINDSNTNVNTAIADLTSVVDANKIDIEGKLATETNSRLTLASEVSTRNTFVDGEIARLDSLHQDDSLRLTNAETRLDNIDTDLQNQINSAVNQLNINHQNVEPRTAKLEEYFIIDESGAEPIVKIKPGVQFEVSGNFIHG